MRNCGFDTRDSEPQQLVAQAQRDRRDPIAWSVIIFLAVAVLVSMSALVVLVATFFLSSLQ